MQELSSLTVAQLQRAILIKQQIEALQRELDSITGGNGDSPVLPRFGKKRGMSPKGRAAIAAAQKARWAKIKGNGEVTTETPRRKKRKMSAAARTAIAVAAKARWAKIKAKKVE